MNDVYFEFLIPETVPDARLRDPPLKVKGAEVFPDLVPSAETVYVWNLGRSALRQVGVFYRLRVQMFLGLYICMLVVSVVLFLINAVMDNINGIPLRISCEHLSVGWLVIGLSVIFFNTIIAGLKANRQPKLQKSAIEHFRTRLAHHILTQLNNMDEYMKTVSDNAQRQTIRERRGQLKQRLKEVQTALKHVGNEVRALCLSFCLCRFCFIYDTGFCFVPADRPSLLPRFSFPNSLFQPPPPPETNIGTACRQLDTESEVQKLRILGLSVDSRMLEGFIGLFTATVFTLYQLFS